MAQQFYAHRSPDMDVRVRKIEDWATAFSSRSPTRTGGTPSTAGMNLMGQPLVSGGGGGGGSAPTALYSVPGPFGVGGSAPGADWFAVTAPNASVGGEFIAQDATDNVVLSQASGTITSASQRWGSGVALAAGAGYRLALLDAADAADPAGNAFCITNLYTGQRALILNNAGQLVAGPGNLTFSDAGTNTPGTVLSLKRHSTGTAAAGLAGEIDLLVQNSAGVDALCGWVQSQYTGGTTGAENGSLILGAIFGGARFEAVRIRATGMAVSGGVGGQTWVRNDLFHSGTSLGVFNTSPVAQQAGASAAGIAAITDANVKAAVTALQNALHAFGFITAPA